MAHKKLKTKKKKLEKKEPRRLAVDWGHEKKKEKWYDIDLKKHLDNPPKLKKGMLILVENIPLYKAKKMLELGVKILTCHTMAIKEHREAMGYPRLKHYDNPGHSIDAMVIGDLYLKKPWLFFEFQFNDIKLSYRNFNQIQKARVSATLRAWALEAKENGNRTIDFLNDAEKECEKMMDKCGKGDGVYEYLRGITQIGPRTGGGLYSEADATKFETASKLRRYAGLSVIDGHIQRFVSGESSGYNPELKALLVKRIGDGIIKSSGTNHPSAYFIDYTAEKTRLQKMEPKEINIEDKGQIIGDLLWFDDVQGFEKGDRIYKHLYPKLKKALAENGSKKTVLIKLSDGHIHNRAIRKAVQLLLEDYWVISRQLQGFNTVPPYATTVAGHVNYRRPRYIPKILEPFDPMRETGWIFAEGHRPWSSACEYIRDKCGK